MTDARFQRSIAAAARAAGPAEDTATHYPNLPEALTLERTDRVCSAVTPAPRGRGAVKRVFHEAGPVAYYGDGTAAIRCIHCAREFETP